ncbi:hypothetical protein KEM56_002292 [Ascosphaera pollenicola]|nr:hypothetical protein KEM56_002292 [Ascosphaera pollenicola]
MSKSECTWPLRKPPVIGAADAASSPATIASGASHQELVAAGAAAAEPFGPSKLAVADLRLLHHFTLYASQELGQPFHDVIRWQDGVVNLAFDHHFLLRGILAVSALHLATARRDEYPSDLLLQSAIHMDAALGEFRGLLQNTPDSKQMYDAIFLLACLLAVHGFGSLKTQPASDPIDAFIHCAGLIQGAKLVTVPHNWATLKRDDISALVSISRRQRQPVIYEKPEICLLRERITAMPLPSPPLLPHAAAFGPVTENGSPALVPSAAKLDIDTEIDRMVYLRTIDELNETFSDIESCGPQKPFAIGLMCAWPASLSDSFMELLSRRRPLALVILAHFAVLLRNHESSWFLDGWDRKLLDAVEKAIPPGFEVFLAWPKRCIRGMIM